MTPKASDPTQLVLELATSWGRLERRLDGALSNTRGVSFAEYRMLRVLAQSPTGRCSRVELAEAVGLTPSGVTRALRPLEKLRVVTTERSERDARLALASLTDAGRELVDDASGVFADTVASLMEKTGAKKPTMSDLLERLAQF